MAGSTIAGKVLHVWIKGSTWWLSHARVSIGVGGGWRQRHARGVMTHLSGSRRVRVFIIIKVTTIETLLGHVSSGSDAEGIKLGIEIGLRLDE